MNKTIVQIMHARPEVVYTCPYCNEKIEESFTDFLDEQELPWGRFYNWADGDFYDWIGEDIFCPECGEKLKNVYFEFD